MAAPSEEKLIGDKFNLEALIVNQVKSFKALADGKDVFIGTKTGSGIFACISSITCAPCKTSSDKPSVAIQVPLLSTLGGTRIHFEDSRFNISLVTATSTRIQSEDVLHGAHVIDEM
jgi:hypothetical protein